MAFQNNGCDITLNAATDFTAQKYRLVKVNAAGRAALANATDLDQIGVTQTNPPALQAVSIRVDGVTKVVAGAAIAAGARVTSDANGAAIVAVTGRQVIGIALQAAAAAGDIIPILLSPRGIV